MTDSTEPQAEDLYQRADAAWVESVQLRKDLECNLTRLHLTMKISRDLRDGVDARDFSRGPEQA